MSREVRKVPSDWSHPRRPNGSLQPMFNEDYETAANEWLDNCALWSSGKHPSQSGEYASDTPYYWEYDGNPPDPEYYMPKFDPEQCTYFQMYETCSEGTPISPPMKTPQLLARWLADTGASSFADMTATYDQWLDTIEAGWAVSAVMVDGELKSGVADTKEPDND